MVWHETCKCVCRLTKAICNGKQVWNKDKCWCECREDLINKLVCEKGYIWNLSTCEYECDKLCDVGQYLDYRICVCRKSVVDRLVKVCINIVDGDGDAETLLVPVNNCSSLTYIVLFIVFLLVVLLFIGIEIKE